jgi:hypothetical protein
MDFKEMSAVSTAGKRSMSIMESVLFEQNNPCFLYSISFRDMDIISVWTHLMAQSSAKSGSGFVNIQQLFSPLWNSRDMMCSS